MLQLEVGLRSCWSLVKYSQGVDKHSRMQMRQEEGGDGSGRSKGAIIDETIRDPFYWAYLHMLKHVAKMQTKADGDGGPIAIP